MTCYPSYQISQHYGRLEDAVKERTEQLERANAAKSIFLATMTHEIRTPLNGKRLAFLLSFCLGLCMNLHDPLDLKLTLSPRAGIIGKRHDNLPQSTFIIFIACSLGMSGLLADTPMNLEQEDLVRTIRDCGDSLMLIVNDVVSFNSSGGCCMCNST